MKKLFTVILMLGVLNNLFSAKDYFSLGSGLWTDGTIWSTKSHTGAVANSYPTEGDDVYIDGHHFTLNIALLSEPGIEIYISNGGSITSSGNEGLYIAQNGNLSLNHGTIDVETIEFKGTGTIFVSENSSITTEDWLHNSADVTINGTLTIGTEFVNTGTITGSGTIGAATYSGTGKIFGIVADNISDGTTIGGWTWEGTAGTTDWNTVSNWTSGEDPVTIPTDTCNVSILSGSTQPIISGSRNAKSITINTGAVLTIASGGNLTVAEDITNNTGNSGLIIQSTSASLTGSLIFATGTPNATVQRYITQNEWHLVTPMTDVSNAQNFYLGAANLSWLAEYDETNNEYDYITDENASLSRAKGYSYWIDDLQGPQKIEFTGALTSTDVVVPLTKSVSPGEGWNLIGNPFPSALNWATVTAGNTTGIAYVWDNSLSGYLYSTGGTTGGIFVGTLPNNIIPLGQGFLVQVNTTAGSFTIPEASRVHNAAAFIKSANNNKNNQTQFVRIDLDGGYYGNTVFVGFPENGTGSFDISGDATKLYSSTENIQFFAVENDDELCINANAPLTEGESKTVPLNLVQITDGNYTMEFSDLDQLENADITLEDLKTGNAQNIRENAIYTFNASNIDNSERFLLHFAWAPDGIEDIDDAYSNMQIYSFGNEIYIRSKDEAINQYGDVYIYDLVGRELSQHRITGSELIKIPVNLSNGYVIVKVVKQSSTKIQKIFIK